MKFKRFCLQVTAININAELNSPNRESEVLQLTIETYQDRKLPSMHDTDSSVATIDDCASQNLSLVANVAC